MNVPFIDLKKQHQSIKKELKGAVERVLDSQQFVMRDHMRHLESEVARRSGARFGVGVASGTDALYLALWALGIEKGDEVITTPFTFFASASSIARVGAKPVFADVDSRTFNLDPSRIESRITPRTKAILVVHLFGLPCDMEPILKIARKRSLFVIEDVAQAFGAEYKGKRAGSFGEVSCFSFYPTKNLGGIGDGGMVVTSSEEIVKKIKLIRDHGQVKKYHHEFVGINSRLDEIQAAALLVKLKYIERWNRLRRKHAADYDKKLKDLPVQTPLVPKGYEHVYHLYSILTDRREALLEFLIKKGIGAGVYYPLPLHLQPCFKELGYKKGDLPVTEALSERILSIPMYAELSEKSKDFVTASIREFFGVKK